MYYYYLMVTNPSGFYSSYIRNWGYQLPIGEILLGDLEILSHDNRARESQIGKLSPISNLRSDIEQHGHIHGMLGHFLMDNSVLWIYLITDTGITIM